MSARRYRVRKRMELGAAAYAVTALAQLAEGHAYPAEAREWAQEALDSMVAAGHIEPRDEDES